jgi:hypothetical protein
MVVGCQWSVIGKRRKETAKELRPKARKPVAEWSPIGNFVEQSLKRLGVRHEVHKISLEEWCRSHLGESGRRALTRVTVRKETVVLEMNHPAWLQEMQSRRGEVLKALQTAFPAEGYKELQAVLSRRKRE